MDQIVNRWWLLTLRGLAAIAFAIITFVAPLASLFALVLVFGAYALVDGILYLALAVRGARRSERWGWFVFAGISGILAGILTFVWPGISALALLFVIAAWAMATGVAAIFAAVRLRKQIRGEWLLAISGVLSVVFGALLVIFPGAGALAVVIWIGAWALAFGVVLVALSLRLRALRTRQAHPAPTGAVPAAS
jgi:uncharacterized membrane protein HdeD (DUF308 family)